MGHVAAWRMAIRRLKEYRSKVDAAMLCHGACSHCLTDYMWLRQMDRHFAGVGMGHVAAWRMAIRRPKEYCSKVDAATRCRGACFH